MNDVSIKSSEWNEKNLQDLLCYLSNTQGLKLILSYENENVEHDGDMQTMSLLTQIGIQPNLKGYQYLRTAIEMCMKDRSELDGITKRLYPKVAKQYYVDSSRVEHAIRHAISNAWKKEDHLMREKLFGYSMGAKSKPTNAAFIATITDYLTVRSISS